MEKGAVQLESGSSHLLMMWNIQSAKSISYTKAKEK